MKGKTYSYLGKQNGRTVRVTLPLLKFCDDNQKYRPHNVRKSKWAKRTGQVPPLITAHQFLISYRRHTAMESESIMNGNSAPQAQAPVGAVELTENCKQVVKLLSDLLEGARQGKIVSIGVVVVSGPGQYTSAGTLAGLLELSSGADDLKDTIKNAIRAQAQAAAQQQVRPPGILRPDPGFDPQHRG